MAEFLEPSQPPFLILAKRPSTHARTTAAVTQIESAWTLRMWYRLATWPYPSTANPSQMADSSTPILGMRLGWLWVISHFHLCWSQSWRPKDLGQSRANATADSRENRNIDQVKNTSSQSPMASFRDNPSKWWITMSPTLPLVECQSVLAWLTKLRYLGQPKHGS